MAGRTLDWKEELGRFLRPFLARLGHKARRQMCPLYVSGLIGPGDRKSIQPMARRLALGACDQLHHFIAAGVWDAGPLETELLVQADKLVGGSDAVLVIDDTAIPKKGTHSVGVAAQYASALGKTANCQTLVSLSLRGAKSRSCWRCGCFFPRVGRTSGPGWNERVFRPSIERGGRSRSWLWRRSIVSSRPACASAASWRMPVMGSARRSARRSRLANWPGRSAFRGTSKSTHPMCR